MVVVVVVGLGGVATKTERRGHVSPVKPDGNHPNPLSLCD